jgi:RecG-like helicase
MTYLTNNPENNENSGNTTPNMFFVQADPGSGKTYSSMLEALKKAKDGYVVIFAFPTKVLIEENEDLGTSLIEQNKEFDQVSLHTHHFHSHISENVLFEIFIKRRRYYFDCT